jgi:uncharacterized protein (DUF1697 family)
MASDKPLKNVALLRGINVGGKNMLLMKALTKMFEESGCSEVRTYLQSGNVIFCASPSVVKKLAGLITRQIAEKFGYRVPLILRTSAELRRVLEENPFFRAGIPEETLHVYFLADLPSAKAVEALDPKRSSPDVFQVRDREIYLQLPNGMARTKLTNAYFDARLSTTSTARNWRTITKLCELTSD